MEQPSAIFVYGTLKRGGVREQFWPRKPVAVERAKVRGALYDLGRYPAMVEGGDVVEGEVWSFAGEDLEVTLKALDEVEGYSGGADDLYRRVVVECETAAGVVRAWAYVYAQLDELCKAQRVLPNSSGVCVWTRHKSPGGGTEY